MQIEIEIKYLIFYIKLRNNGSLTRWQIFMKEFHKSCKSGYKDHRESCFRLTRRLFFSRRKAQKEAENASCLNPADWCPPEPSVPVVLGKPCGFPHRRSVRPDAARLITPPRIQAVELSVLGKCFRLPPLSQLSHSSQLSHETPSTKPFLRISVSTEIMARTEPRPPITMDS